MKPLDVMTSYVRERRPKDMAIDVIVLGAAALFAKSMYDVINRRENEAAKEEKDEF